MGGHSWRPGGRRSIRGRLAAVAALTLTAGAVLVGVGFADTTAPVNPPAPVNPLSAPGGPDRLKADLPLLATESAAVENPAGGPSSRATAPSAQVPAAAAPATGPAPASTAPVPAGPPAEGLVAGTPCTPTAKACVDLATKRAWLLDGNRIVRGPVGSRHGSHDEPTPVGTFTVQWKAEQYTSREYGSPMPFSVFFAPGGVAFHEGRQDTPSAGCVKLGHEDAVAWFGYLQVGDEVQIH